MCIYMCVLFVSYRQKETHAHTPSPHTTTSPQTGRPPRPRLRRARHPRHAILPQRPLWPRLHPGGQGLRRRRCGPLRRQHLLQRPAADNIAVPSTPPRKRRPCWRRRGVSQASHAQGAIRAAAAPVGPLWPVGREELCRQAHGRDAEAVQGGCSCLCLCVGWGLDPPTYMYMNTHTYLYHPTITTTPLTQISSAPQPPAPRWGRCPWPPSTA